MEDKKQKFKEYLDKEIEIAEWKHKEHFDKEVIMNVGYHSKLWKVPKWLLSATREGIIKEIKQKLEGLKVTAKPSA